MTQLSGPASGPITPTLTATGGASRNGDSEAPGILPVPRDPLAGVLARGTRVLLRRVAERFGVRVVEVPAGADGPAADGVPTLLLHRPDEFYRRLGRHGLIGFGEGYQTGAWDSPDLELLLTTLAADLPRLVPEPLQRLRATYVARQPRRHRNRVGRTRANISHHYDLSNDLFAAFLDPTMSYSSALFGDVADEDEVHDAVGAMRRRGLPAAVAAQGLDSAQGAKLERCLDAAGVGAGTRLLEIGTGWGELALRAARRGASVRSVTLSSEQQALARQRVAEASRTEPALAERVQIDLLDYRQVEGSYDAICSVEMIEAVGREYWPTYFSALDRLLAPGGRVAIQAITMPHDRMLATSGSYTWINKYIFPGGFLPSQEAIDDITREHTGLRVTDRLGFAAHYVETLRRWDAAFLSYADRAKLSETFTRTWHFYLVYSLAGFAAGYLDVSQLTLTREAR